MDFQDYMQQATKTDTTTAVYAKMEAEYNMNPIVLHALLGFKTEHAEIVDAIKKQFYGKPLDIVNIGEEIGDMEWYLASLAKYTYTLTSMYPNLLDPGSYPAGEYPSYMCPNHLDLNGLRECCRVPGTTSKRSIIDIAFDFKLNSEYTKSVLRTEGSIDSLSRSHYFQDLVRISMYVGGYIDTMCQSFDLDITTIRRANIAKLKKRYKGKFSSGNALNRDLQKERQSLNNSIGLNLR